jgi:hypothetical protein
LIFGSTRSLRLGGIKLVADLRRAFQGVGDFGGIKRFDTAIALDDVAENGWLCDAHLVSFKHYR